MMRGSVHATDPTLRNDLNVEERSLKDDIEKLPVFPVAVMGLSYTF